MEAKSTLITAAMTGVDDEMAEVLEHHLCGLLGDALLRGRTLSLHAARRRCRRYATGQQRREGQDNNERA